MGTIRFNFRQSVIVFAVLKNFVNSIIALLLSKTCVNTFYSQIKISFFLFLAEYIMISTIASCDDVVYLAAIYGIIVGGAVIGFSLCLATLLVMVNSVSWKNPWKVSNIIFW